MTWVALIFTPLVLLYQGWTYWVFRKRLAVPAHPRLPPAPVRDPAEPVGGGVKPLDPRLLRLRGGGPRLPRRSRSCSAWPPPR